jgi:dipeptidase D
MAKPQQKKSRLQSILDMFQRISEIPRCSKKEEKICRWLMQWAEEHSMPAQMDKTGNILIRVPGTKGYENAAPVVIQGHVDMVCEKDADSPHNFDTDPIRFVYEGDWLKADKTSLGSDNGIAIAMALVLAEDPTTPHPPLELLFTVDEETGLTGAINLEGGWMKGKIMLNLDSEDEGTFTIGCAGGRDTQVRLPLAWDEVPGHFVAYTLKIDGIMGGHSGVNIHVGRASALKLIARALRVIHAQSDMFLNFITGGTAHNAIPRLAEARVFIPADKADEVAHLVNEVFAAFRKEYSKTDPGLQGQFQRVDELPDRRAMTLETSEKVMHLMLAFPHGVAAMSKDIPGLVETSSNFASVRIEDGELRIVSSQRSSVMSRLDAVTAKVEAVAKLAGAWVHSNVGYPSWEPNTESPLLETFKKTYKKLFKKDAHVEAIHAGLECGLVGAKYPGMDMISFGVTLKDPHSPSEAMYLPSVEKVWDLMCAVLKDLK